METLAFLLRGLLVGTASPRTAEASGTDLLQVTQETNSSSGATECWADSGWEDPLLEYSINRIENGP